MLHNIILISFMSQKANCLFMQIISSKFNGIIKTKELKSQPIMCRRFHGQKRSLMALPQQLSQVTIPAARRQCSRPGLVLREVFNKSSPQHPSFLHFEKVIDALFNVAPELLFKVYSCTETLKGLYCWRHICIQHRRIVQLTSER